MTSSNSKPPVALFPPALPSHLSPTDASTPLLPTIVASLALSSNWTGLQTHTHSPLPPYATLPRAMLSGYPPIDLYPETRRTERRREWVLPASLAEKWTLRQWAETFDAIGRLPPEIGEDGSLVAEHPSENMGTEDARKRLLMAVVGSDGTVVYYFVHDGVVKPRQN